jgi:hypothetical protein
MEIEGLPRSYFYRRLAGDMRQVLQKSDSVFPSFLSVVTLDELSDIFEPDQDVETLEQEHQQEMVMKVNVQESLNRLSRCPVCSAELVTYPNYPQERSCGDAGCGEFTITDVWLDGDVSFQFKMASPEKLAADNVAQDEFNRSASE